MCQQPAFEDPRKRVPATAEIPAKRREAGRDVGGSTRHGTLQACVLLLPRRYCAWNWDPMVQGGEDNHVERGVGAASFRNRAPDANGLLRERRASGCNVVR
jgi:hypothetical protein